MSKTKLTLLLLAIAALSCILGFALGKNSAKDAGSAKYYYLSQLNLAANYRTLVEISQDIAGGKVAEAKCVTDVTASAYYRELQSCLANGSCRTAIEDEVRKSAPELISGDKSKFAYYEDMQRCSHK